MFNIKKVWVIDPNFVVYLILYIFFFSYLLQDLPQLIEGRIDYFEPSFEAMIRSGVSFVFLRTWQVLSQSWLLYIPQEVNTQGRPKRIYVVHGKTTALVWTHSLETWLVPRRALLKSTPRVSQQKNCKARGDDESMRGKRGKSMQARDISYWISTADWLKKWSKRLSWVITCWQRKAGQIPANYQTKRFRHPHLQEEISSARI